MNNIDSQVKPEVDLDYDKLLKQLKKMEFNDDTKALRMEDILDRITIVKEAERKRLEDMKPKHYVPPGGWKEQKSLRITSKPAADSRRVCKNMHSIARFRPSIHPWDGSFALTRELSSAIYRIPQSDPSGKQLFAVTRDDHPKGTITWKPAVSYDRDIPEPTLTMLTHSCQNIVRNHMSQTVQFVADEYKKLPCSTDAQRNLKARVGADLNNLTLARDRVVNEKQERLHSPTGKHGSTKH